MVPPRGPGRPPRPPGLVGFTARRGRGPCSVMGLAAKERDFRVRTSAGNELTLVREAGNRRYADEDPRRATASPPGPRRAGLVRQGPARGKCHGLREGYTGKFDRFWVLRQKRTCRHFPICTAPPLTIFRAPPSRSPKTTERRSGLRRVEDVLGIACRKTWFSPGSERPKPLSSWSHLEALPRPSTWGENRSHRSSHLSTLQSFSDRRLDRNC